MNETLYRKYRPMAFKEVVGQKHVTETLANQILNDQVAHAYLFTGPRGVGKTTVARLLAKAVNCERRKGAEPCGKCDSCLEITSGNSIDVYEIDAATNTQVDKTRENIIESVRFAPNKSKYKVYIIDEVHMLSSASFNALLKTLEEPPGHAIFVLATTEIHKVPETIISRCQRFDFHRVDREIIIKRLQKIIKQEGIEVAREVLDQIARQSEGCLRDAESLLGQILALGEKKISATEASLVLPLGNNALVIDFIDKLAQSDAVGAIILLNELVEQGTHLDNFTDEIIGALRSMLFAKLGGLERLDLEFDNESSQKLAKLTESFSSNRLVRAINVFLKARQDLAHQRIPQLPLELAVVELCRESGEEAVSSSGSSDRDSQPPDNAGSLEEKTREDSVKPADKIDPADILSNKPSNTKKTKISLDTVKKKWGEIFENIAERNASLPLVLQSVEILGLNDNCLQLGFQFEFHAQMINEPKNKILIEQAVGEVLRANLAVQGVHRVDERDEVVSDIMAEFGGQEVGV